MPKTLKRLLIIFIIFVISIGAWAYSRANNSDIIFGEYEKSPEVFVSDNNYAFTYKDDNDRSFVCINKNIYGPYNDAKITSLANQKFGFVYAGLDYNDWYININDDIFGPYQNAGEVSVSNNSFGFSYQQDNQWYVNIKNNIYGPFPLIKNVAVSDNNFIFVYQENNQDYLFINNQTRQAPGIIEKVFANQNGVSYVYVLGGEKYVYFNNRTYGSFNVSSPVFLFENGFAFWYLDQGNVWINFNGVVMGPYESVSILKNSQDMAFYYKKSENKNYFISTSTKASGPYKYDFAKGSASQKKIGLAYMKGNSWQVVIMPLK